VFISDALNKIKSGKAQGYEGELKGKAFRVLAARPFEDILLGYVYTQNGTNSKVPLSETLNFKNCSGCDIVRTADDVEGWVETKLVLELSLNPGQSDLVVFVHEKPKVTVSVLSRVNAVKMTKGELLGKTKAEGKLKKIAGTNCTVKTFKGPHSFGMLAANG